MAEPGLYVLAAVVVHPDQAEDVRETLRAGVRHLSRPFHWRLEEHTDQESLAKTVGALDLVSVVAIATPVDKHRPERLRKLCLLLWLPDLVAGAVNRARFDELDCCLQPLGGGVTILEVGDAT